MPADLRALDVRRLTTPRSGNALYSVTLQVVRDVRREDGVVQARRVVTINYLGN